MDVFSKNRSIPSVLLSLFFGFAAKTEVHICVTSGVTMKPKTKIRRIDGRNTSMHIIRIYLHYIQHVGLMLLKKEHATEWEEPLVKYLQLLQGEMNTNQLQENHVDFITPVLRQANLCSQQDPNSRNAKRWTGVSQKQRAAGRLSSRTQKRRVPVLTFSLRHRYI